MIIVTCVPPPGYDSYRCGWREEERDGRKVRIGLCWKAGATELPDDALTREQIEMLKRDPGKRITVRELPGVEHGREARGKASPEAKGKASKESGEEKGPSMAATGET
ncbi:hypothetical protein [Polyangium fumosum]|uniref:Uncharacterized protein n=1 Tax=Polyangium fumosum TaxID=889272 RepID=A0A4U1J7S4_9BACT|nr:hypothetical protein [Polyangium fumosum]TKD03439.1 hypothetical protein E8A74_26105 [Polyangium fumosum]